MSTTQVDMADPNLLPRNAHDQVKGDYSFHSILTIDINMNQVFREFFPFPWKFFEQIEIQYIL